MLTNSVNISFGKELLDQIDRTAREESRSRAEVIRQAARLYLDRKTKWARIFEFGERQAAKLGIKEDDITREIKKYRQEKGNSLA